MTDIKLKNIGSLLHEAGKLEVADAEKVLIEQRKNGTRFGDAAIKLGYVTEKDIKEVLSRQFDHTYIAEHNDTLSPDLIMVRDGDNNGRQAFYRSLRAQLSLKWFSENKALVLASSGHCEKLAVVGTNLAASFAEIGQRTLVVDVNMQSPQVHTLLGIDNTLGFSDVLADRVGLECIKQASVIKNLFVLTAGTPPPNPLELLGRSSLARIVDELVALFDVVIFASKEAPVLAELTPLVSLVEGCVLIEKKNCSELSKIKTLSKQLKSNEIELLGVALSE